MKKKGFTLAELLIVVAIIAVLVAIAIPVFSTKLHEAKVAADMANVRAYYAELQADYMSTNKKVDIIPDRDWYFSTEIKHLDGTTTKLQTGQFGIAPFNADKGYQLYYICNSYYTDHDHHSKHELLLGNY